MPIPELKHNEAELRFRAAILYEEIYSLKYLLETKAIPVSFLVVLRAPLQGPQEGVRRGASRHPEALSFLMEVALRPNYKAGGGF